MTPYIIFGRLLNKINKRLKRKSKINTFVLTLFLEASSVLHVLTLAEDCSTELLQPFQNICYHA